MDKDPARTTNVILEAAQLTGQRIVLSKGWANLGRENMPSQVKLISNVSHAQLFPKMAAIVHHGGAGTSTTAAKSGKPQIIVPHFGDQYFWADRMQKLGVCAATLPKNKLNAHDLANAITRTLTNSELKQASEKLSQKVFTLNGAQQALDAVLKSLEHG